MPRFPALNNGIVSQLPYREGDDFPTSISDWVESGFATTAPLNAANPQRVFKANFPAITAAELATFEAFVKAMGQTLTFAYPADDGTIYTKCRFDSPDYTVSYSSPNQYAVSIPIRALKPTTITAAQVVVAASLNITTAHTPGAYADYAGVSVTVPAGAKGAVPDFGTVFSQSAWTKRTDTFVLDPTVVDLWDLANLVVSFGMQGTLIPPSGTPGITTVSAFIVSASPASQFLVYDVTLSVTYADTSTATLRPASYAIEAGDAPGDTATNPANATDTSSTTAATLTRAYFGPFQFGGQLQVTNFQ